MTVPLDRMSPRQLDTRMIVRLLLNVPQMKTLPPRLVCTGASLPGTKPGAAGLGSFSSSLCCAR